MADIRIMLRSFSEMTGMAVFLYFDSSKEEDLRLLRKPMMNASQLDSFTFTLDSSRYEMSY